MRIFNVSTIREWQAGHANARDALQRWYRTALAAEWRNLQQVREAYPAADQVGSCLVFNIMGNQYRLIGGVSFPRPTITLDF